MSRDADTPRAGRSPARSEAARGPASRGSSEAPVGIFGGTFNPIHLGHLRAAEEVREALGLARVVFVPSADPPLKRGGADAMAPARARLAWVELAIRGNPAFAVDALELERPGPSYTVDTLRELGHRLAPAPLVFVLGCDAFAELSCWREPKALLALAHFAVMTRPPGGGGSLADWIPAELAADLVLAPGGDEARHRSAGTWLRRVPIAALDVSSTDVRRRLREGRSVRYLLPDPVLDEVVRSGVYAGRGQK
jgi:nicotinate-nucleotide adenylyltransferase